MPTTADGLKRLSAKFSPSGLQSIGIQSVGLQPERLQPGRVLPERVQPERLLAVGLLVHRSSARRCSARASSRRRSSVRRSSARRCSARASSRRRSSAHRSSARRCSATRMIAQAFSSAQTRSIIGVSATPGTGDETVVVNSGTRPASSTSASRAGAAPSTRATCSRSRSRRPARVHGRHGHAPHAAHGDADAGGFATVILTDSSRLALGERPGIARAADRRTSARDPRSMASSSTSPATRGSSSSATQADAATNRGCPFAQNLVAEEIKSIVDSYRATAATRCDRDVALRDDRRRRQRSSRSSATPTRACSAGVRLRPAGRRATRSPRRACAVTTSSARTPTARARRSRIRTTAFPVPDLAVGRLVETPAEITGMIDAYIDGQRRRAARAPRSSPATTS